MAPHADSDVILPRGVAELQEHWRDLPPTLSPDAVLEAGWFPMSRSPFYRALGRGEIPCVRMGRRLFVLTTPTLRLLGIDTTRS